MENLFSPIHTGYLLPKIMIFEDDLPTAEVLQFFFQMNSYICRIKRSGKDALNYIKQEQPSLIIADYLLPELNGMDLCQAVKNDQLTKSYPVILYSAYPNIDQRAAQHGCDEFIAKPFDLDDVMRKVQRLLSFNAFTIHHSLNAL